VQFGPAVPDRPGRLDRIVEIPFGASEVGRLEARVPQFDQESRLGRIVVGDQFARPFEQGEGRRQVTPSECFLPSRAE